MNSGHAIFVQQQRCNGVLMKIQIGCVFAGLTHVIAIQIHVRLCARTPDGRTFGTVENSELQTGRVDCRAHFAAESVDLFDEVPLGSAANRRIAGHLTDAVQTHRKQTCLAAHARTCQSSLNSGVTTTDDDNFIFK